MSCHVDEVIRLAASEARLAGSSAPRGSGPRLSLRRSAAP